MIHARGEACLGGVEQTACCHMVESNTTDGSCGERANMPTEEKQGDGETKTEASMQKEKKWNVAAVRKDTRRKTQ